MPCERGKASRKRPDYTFAGRAGEQSGEVPPLPPCVPLAYTSISEKQPIWGKHEIIDAVVPSRVWRLRGSHSWYRHSGQRRARADLSGALTVSCAERRASNPADRDHHHARLSRPWARRF